MPEETKKEDGLNQKHPKKGGMLNKYKWWIVGGLAVIAILVFFFVNRSGSQGQTTASAPGQNSGIDPSTGLPYASEYGGFGGGMFGGSTPGPAGPAGARGPRGKPGKRGRPGRGAKPGAPKITRSKNPRMHPADTVASTMHSGARTAAYTNSTRTHVGTLR